MIGRPFNSEHFQPIAGVGDYIAPMRQREFVDEANPFFEVEAYEPLVGLAPHGAILLWAAAGAAPAGYALDPNTNLAAAIPAGGVAACSPQVLQADGDEFIQLRWLADFVGAPAVGAAQDVDVLVSQPAAVRRFGTKNAARGGVWNQAFQYPLPAASQVKPAQGANMVQELLAASADPFERAYLTELFIYGQQNSPTWQIVNNGAAALAAGAFAIQVAGFRYKVRQANTNEGGDWVSRFLLGKERQVPPHDRWVGVPIVGIG